MARAGIDPLSVEGSLKNGGRYNARGEFGALYTSLEEMPAVAEVARGLKARGVDPEGFPPRSWWLYTLDAQIEDVLDLTDPAVLDRLGLRPEQLAGQDATITRRLAAEARQAGYRAMIAPSAAVPGSKNLIIFPDRMLAPPRFLRSAPVALGG